MIRRVKKDRCVTNARIHRRRDAGGHCVASPWPVARGVGGIRESHNTSAPDALLPLGAGGVWQCASRVPRPNVLGVCLHNTRQRALPQLCDWLTASFLPRLPILTRPRCRHRGRPRRRVGHWVAATENSEVAVTLPGFTTDGAREMTRRHYAGAGGEPPKTDTRRVAPQLPARRKRSNERDVSGSCGCGPGACCCELCYFKACYAWCWRGVASVSDPRAAQRARRP